MLLGASGRARRLPGALRKDKAARPAPRDSGCRAVQSPPGAEELHLDWQQRFETADIDGNGFIDRDEFQRLAESFQAGTEYSMFHWLPSDTIEDLFNRYADAEKHAITIDSFKSLFEDGVLLEGRLSEYRDLFQSCPSWRKDGPGLGMIERSCVVGLAGRLEHPLPQAEARNALQTFCDSRACRVPDEPLTFADFLNMFRDDLLDLQQIEEYMKLEADPHPSFSPDEVQEAAHSLPEAAQGVHIIQSSEQFEALVKVNADRTVVLLAGLSWCRPCKGLTRPMEKLAKHYADGAVFAKVMGDHSDNTKRFFKNVLEVKATPHVSIWRWGGKAYTRVGANKTKLEEAVRRFYNTDYALPDKMLYPPLVKPQPAGARR